MLGVLRIFFGAKGANQWLILGCLLAAGLAEGIGLASLLPLLSVDFDQPDAPAEGLSATVLQVLDFLGLPRDFVVLLLIVVAGIVAKSILVVVAMLRVGYAVADVATHFRTDLIQALLAVRWGYFTRQPLGSIANAASLEATRAGMAYLMAAKFVANTIQSVVYVALSFLVSWRLALVALGVGGIILLVLGIFVRWARKAGRRQTKRTHELVTQLSDALIGIKPIMAMARQAQFAKFFESKTESLRRALRRQTISQQMIDHLREPLLAIFIGIAVLIAKSQNSLDLSALIVMAVLWLRVVTTIASVQRQLQKALMLESGYWLIHKLVKETEAEREPPHGTAQPTLTKGCALENVDFAYAKRPVLVDASMQVPAGRVTVITGASGGGKTTITDLLLGFYAPDRGQVLVDGVPLHELDIQAWRGMIGYVGQELTLFHDSVLSNIILGDPTLGEDDARAALEAAGAWDFVAALPDGLQTPVGERGTRLSGGQRQRIALARALVHRPKLLILDEVTSALEPEKEAEICNNITRLAGDITVLAITHRPVWAAVADRVYHLGADGLMLQETYDVAAEAM